MQRKSLIFNSEDSYLIEIFLQSIFEMKEEEFKKFLYELCLNKNFNNKYWKLPVLDTNDKKEYIYKKVEQKILKQYPLFKKYVVKPSLYIPDSLWEKLNKNGFKANLIFEKIKFFFEKENISKELIEKIFNSLYSDSKEEIYYGLRKLNFSPNEIFYFINYSKEISNILKAICRNKRTFFSRLKKGKNKNG